MDSQMRVDFFLRFITTAAFTLCICNGYVGVPCKESERQALLMLKKDLKDPSNMLLSWAGEGDCCAWTKVVCDNLTGHVQELHLSGNGRFEYSNMSFGGKVNPSLLNLSHLSYLDLSNNAFGGIEIPGFLGSLKSLRYLNLSIGSFQGIVPHQLGNLSSLRYLDLGGYNHLAVDNLQWLSNLSLLEHLDMNFVDLGNPSAWFQVTKTLPSLVELHMDSCSLDRIPIGIANMTRLKVLDLRRNYINSTIPQWLYRLSRLESLILSGNDFHGEVSSSIGNLTSLVHLDLLEDNLEGEIPNSLGNLCKLTYLDLGHNKFKGHVSAMLERLSRCSPGLESLILSSNDFHGEVSSSIGNLTSLVHLDLSMNQLEGEILNSLGNLCKLTYLDLGYNKFEGRVSEFLESLSRCYPRQIEILALSYNNLSDHLPDQLRSFKNLRELDLSSNSISGPIPVSVGNLSFLEYFIISNNSLNGVVSEVHFTNLTRLNSFLANENSLTLKTSPHWLPPFQLTFLTLGSWRLEPSEIPVWLQSQKSLGVLDMTSTGISGVIPPWFWNFSSGFEVLDLSHNELYGQVPNIISPYWSKPTAGDLLITIDLNSNQFTGSLPLVSSTVYALDLSNSSFSGTVSHFFCDQTDGPKKLEILHLHHNSLSGQIPDCWSNWPNLTVVNLDNNSLSGRIPGSLGYLLSLQSLHLRNNNLSGEVPMSLQNCEKLLLLDLGGNKFVGSIPTWIGKSLWQLVVLSLRSNKFHGNIPGELCGLEKIQILDIAHNNLSGPMPRCFQNFTSMASSNSDSGGSSIYYLDLGIGSGYAPSFGSISVSFIESVIFVTKGREVKYDKILRLGASLDLSSNIISGEIPEELTSLIGLQSLNLSDNLLTGKIPSKIGNMISLESLDLSMNQLSGEISPSMSNLTFLNYLNLSNNNLKGPIPKSTQLQSFGLSTYAGNQLCGPPLDVNCTTNGALPPVGDQKHRGNHFIEDGGFYLSLGLGFLFGFWIVLGSLLLTMPWSNVTLRQKSHQTTEIRRRF